MSPKPQGKQSEKKENPVKIKFPAVVSWPNDRYCGLDHAAVKTEKILCTSNGSKGLQNLTNICGYVNLLQ
jgi:hypothetical protein